MHVAWEKERYDECITKLTPFLKASGWAVGGDDVIFIPISGLGGINLKDRIPAGMCSFYSGPSLIELLDTIKQPARYFEMPFRMPIHDKYKDMGTIILGKVFSAIYYPQTLVSHSLCAAGREWRLQKEAAHGHHAQQCACTSDP